MGDKKTENLTAEASTKMPAAENKKNKFQNSNAKKTFFKVLPYLSVILITAAIVLVVYAIRHIFPFGTGSVVADDMVQQTIPNYVYFWDWLHGKSAKSLLFSWDTAAGAQKLTSGFLITNPLDIIFTLIVPRERIVDGMSFYLLVRLCLCSCTMMFFLKKMFKLDEPGARRNHEISSVNELKTPRGAGNISEAIGPWYVVLSVAYTFSAYIMVYYTNMGWIDAAMLLPLVAYAFIRMMKSGKWLAYLLLTSYFAMKSVYLAFMLYMFLLIVGGFYIIFIQEKKTRKMGIVRFGLTSVGALLLSAWINVPSVYYMISSQRVHLKSKGSMLDTIRAILNTDTTYSQLKLTLILLCTGLLLAFLVILGVNYKKHKKACAFFGLSVLALILPVFFENINLLWHLGSYVSFPLRYMYMLVFIGLCAGGYVLENCDSLLFAVKGKKCLALIAPAVAAAAGGLTVLIMKVYRFDELASGLKYNKLLQSNCSKWMLLSMVLFAVAYFLVMLMGYKRVACVFVSIFLFGEIFTLADVSIGTNSARDGRSEMYDLGFIDDSYKLANDLKADGQFAGDHLTRIKDADVRLNSNYPMLIDYPAMSDFTHMASKELTAAMKAMGYSQIYTRVVDNGGTPLTDALLNIKHTFTLKDVSTDEYTYVKDIGDSKLYENKYTLPLGMIVDKNFIDLDPISFDSPFAYQNALYKNLSGTSDDLFEIEKHIIKKNSNDDENIYNIKVDGKKHVYLFFDIDSSKEVNRGLLAVMKDYKLTDNTYFGGTNNYYYPNNMKNGLIDLGVFSDTEFELELVRMKELKKDINFEIGYADFDLLGDLCEKNADEHGTVETGAKSISATATAKSDTEYMFLPVAYDEGWSLTVNGEKAETIRSMGAFIGIKLNKGENKIEMHYSPKGMNIGIIVSLITALAIIAMYIVSRKKPFANDLDNKFLRAFEKMYFCLIILVIMVVYIVPIMFFIKNNI